MIRLDKQAIRTEAVARRNRLSIEEAQEKSRAIAENVLPYLHGVIGIYHPYGKEVDVTFIQNCYKEGYALPKTYPDHQIRFFEIQDDTTFTKSAYGIQEPVSGKEIKAVGMAVLLIPLVAFDEQCHRLGHGKGFYDRFLQTYQGLRIGVAYECQKWPVIPTDVHDELLDMIITEETIYRRNQES